MTEPQGRNTPDNSFSSHNLVFLSLEIHPGPGKLFGGEEERDGREEGKGRNLNRKSKERRNLKNVSSVPSGSMKMKREMERQNINPRVDPFFFLFDPFFPGKRDVIVFLRYHFLYSEEDVVKGTVITNFGRTGMSMEGRGKCSSPPVHCQLSRQAWEVAVAPPPVLPSNDHLFFGSFPLVPRGGVLRIPARKRKGKK